MPEINLIKSFTGPGEQFQIDVRLEFMEGRVIGLYGPSGSGKTSILRMISGLMRPDSGHISVDEDTWYDDNQKKSKSIQSREVAMVFQGTSLFPNMTVMKNLEFAAQGKWNSSQMMEIAHSFQLTELLNRNVKQLSGGQKQRVELARAILRQPKLLLLDEPFTALDFDNKLILKKVLLNLINKHHITTVLVSHDIGDVISLTDKIYILNQGRVIKEGNPLTVFTPMSSLSNFQISGEIIDIRPDDILNIVSILVGKQVVKVAAHYLEIKDMKVGSRVSISSKAFNPILTLLE